jgi:hypothetical protein
MKCDRKCSKKYSNLIFSFCRPFQKPRMAVLYFRCERSSKASNYACLPNSKKITSRYYKVFLCQLQVLVKTLEISASIFYQILKCFLMIITHM